MVIEHRLIHPSSNRNAAFTRRTGSTQPRSRNEPPSIRYSYCAETTHCSTAFVSRGCTGKGALASALLVERKSRGINVLYRCGCNAYGRCLSLKQNSGETEQCIVRLLRFPLYPRKRSNLHVPQPWSEPESWNQGTRLRLTIACPSSVWPRSYFLDIVLHGLVSRIQKFLSSKC